MMDQDTIFHFERRIRESVKQGNLTELSGYTVAYREYVHTHMSAFTYGIELESGPLKVPTNAANPSMA